MDWKSTDAEQHMLLYWIEAKGIDEAFKFYYPGLAESDPIISAALNQMQLARFALLKRAREIEDDAPSPFD